MIKRRDFLKHVAGGFAGAASGLLLPRSALSGDVGESASATGSAAVLEALPGKQPLIRRSLRPPNFETPVSYFNQQFTPNDAFFVRYHLASVPRLALKNWTLKIRGESAAKALEFTLEDLKRLFEPVEIAAVCQCSGNRRGLVQPHVPGVQWGYGAMGNALWKGIRLRDVLNHVGIDKNAMEVVFNGADTAPLSATPDFAKSLPVAKALDENTLIAFEMNGEPLPYWNGSPARLVVPGWTATYWMKHLATINVIARPFDGFWMTNAYRLPVSLFPASDRFLSQQNARNVPITEILINSLITNVEDGQSVALGQGVDVQGIAWDGGYGIDKVEISSDAGSHWLPAELGADAGRFSWRQWRFRFEPKQTGSYGLMVKATNRNGATQPFTLIQNPAGYHHNVVQQVHVTVV